MSGIFPRYSQNVADQFSSIEHIEAHRPQLLEPESAIQEETETAQTLQITADTSQKQLVTVTPQRRLFSPNVKLQGHNAPVYTIDFSSNGSYLASAGHDKKIFIWDIFDECKNTGLLTGHKNAILDIKFSNDDTNIYTCSADKTLGIFDIETEKKVKKFAGHEGIVNSIDKTKRGLEVIASVSDDNSLRIWDTRFKDPIHVFETKYPLLAVCFNETGDRVFTSGIENTIQVWDLRNKVLEDQYYGHTNTITDLSISHNGNYILSTSMDQTVRCWDIRPFVTGNRCLKIYQGMTHGFDRNLLRVAWSPTGKYLSAGSSDK